MPLHQKGFSLGDNSTTYAEFHTSLPGGFPYFCIKSGKNKAMTFYVSGNELERVLTELIDSPKL